jgi:hypothetical protein
MVFNYVDRVDIEHYSSVNCQRNEVVTATAPCWRFLTWHQYVYDWSHLAYPRVILINADSVCVLRRVINSADHMRPLSWLSIYQGIKIGRWAAMENDFVNTGIEQWTDVTSAVLGATNRSAAERADVFRTWALGWVPNWRDR